jgi:hypothetical protein
VEVTWEDFSPPPPTTQWQPLFPSTLELSLLETVQIVRGSQDS